MEPGYCAGGRTLRFWYFRNWAERGNDVNHGKCMCLVALRYSGCKSLNVQCNDRLVTNVLFTWEVHINLMIYFCH